MSTPCPRAVSIAAPVCALVLALTTVRDAARACAACASGDPTLVAFGGEAPFAGRLRLALETRTRSDRIGTTGDDRVEVDEVRAELGVAWAPLDALFVQVALPWAWRDVRYADAARTTLVSSGDATLRLKLALGPGWSLSAGLSFPTAPVLRDAAGVRLPIEAQPGTGSFDPALGVAWSSSDRDLRPWAFGASLFGVWPTGDANPQLRMDAHVQRELWRDGAAALALRALFEGRLDGRAHDGGAVVHDSGGFVGALGADVALAPANDWLVTVGVRVPVVDALAGAHDEGWSLALSLAWDAR